MWGTGYQPVKRHIVETRNWNVVALSEYADGVGANARLAERHAYTPYGEFVVLKGDAGSGELGGTLPTSSLGNLFFQQGLPLDREKGSDQSRSRARKIECPLSFWQREGRDRTMRCRALDGLKGKVDRSK